VTLILVVNVHGSINSSAPVRRALAELKVIRKFTATVVPDDPATLGMLRRCKDYVSWSPVDADFLGSLLKERGMVSAERPLDQATLKSIGYKGYDDLARKMVEQGLRLSSFKGIKPFFRLAPPKGGFKRSMRRQFTEGGMLGSNPKLQETVKRMV
jgi:large subunit ribosomal protein L30